MSATSILSLSNAGLLPVGAPDAPTGAVLTVGAGEQYATLGAAAAAAPDGATILVDAGTYVNDFATVSTKITIEGVGGMANFVATVPPPNYKGILTVDNDVTIKNLSFSGSAIPDAEGGNGAGIRYEGGQMVLQNDSFSGNQNGLLAFPVMGLAVNTISIDHSVFSGNGSGSGYTHNMYVGAVTSLVATNSVFEGAVVGHEFKSRALANTIVGNVFEDGPTGTASYDIDLPNGGVDLVQGNLIEKGPDAENDAMVHFGGEGIPYAGSSLTITGNSFVDDLGGQALAVLNQTSISAKLAGNAFGGSAAPGILQGPGTATGNTDGKGNPLPDVTLVGVLPGNTTVFTDAGPHTITLDHSGEAVQGGAGALTVIDPAGHIVAEGGAGGMSFTEGQGAGGSTITTVAGSTNTLSMVGQDLIDSEGTDTLTTGGGNVTGVLGGTATVSDGTGNNQWAVNGTAAITGHGGSPLISLANKATLSVGGTLANLEVQDNGGTAAIAITLTGNASTAPTDEGVTVSGAADIRMYGGLTRVVTAGGAPGATVVMGAGSSQITSAGADVIRLGGGDATVIVSGAASVYAGTGALSVFGRGDNAGATVYGNGGTVLLDGDTGNITYRGGDKANTVQDRLSHDTLVGGAGLMTVLGGSGEVITGGSGGVVYGSLDGGGANVITTAAGATDFLSLAGADTVVSRGRDTIYGGTGNQAITAYGNAAITGSTGNSAISLYGHDTLAGVGQDNVIVHAGAQAMITAGTLTSVEMTNAWTVLSTNGANAFKVSVAGGGALLSGGIGGAAIVVTAAGKATSITSYRGTASEALNGADTLVTGTGTDMVTINAANTVIWAKSGTVSVHDKLSNLGEATIHGGAGTLDFSQDGGALQFIGGAGAATLDGGWGSMDVTGGSGALTVGGGGLPLRFTAGSGSATVALSPGGGDVTFGVGNTMVQVASFGSAATFQAVAGQGGGSDTITGFRIGTDRLVLSGVGIASQTTAGGSTSLVLTDHTHLQMAGVADASHLFG